MHPHLYVISHGGQAVQRGRQPNEHRVLEQGQGSQQRHHAPPEHRLQAGGTRAKGAGQRRESMDGNAAQLLDPPLLPGVALTWVVRAGSHMPAPTTATHTSDSALAAEKAASRSSRRQMSRHHSCLVGRCRGGVE